MNVAEYCTPTRASANSISCGSVSEPGSYFASRPKTMMNQTDLDRVLQAYKKDSGAYQRYASFDYCYNYFRETDDLKKDVEKSCLALGFYLASWGMFRGSSSLLRKSSKHLELTIDYIAGLPRSVWSIDADSYTEENVQKIIEIYCEIKNRLDVDTRTHRTLVTKVLLGVFGFVPAFDEYFTQTFRDISGEECRFRTVNDNSLRVIKDFYEANRTTIDRWSDETFTTDFLTGGPTRTNYPKAKIIDMYGFQRAVDERVRLNNGVL